MARINGISWLALALLLAAVPAGAEPPCPVRDLDPQEGPWILFGSYRGGDFSSSTHAIRMDGTGECQVSSHPSGKPASLDASYSPDGTRMVFTRGSGGSHRTSLWMETGGEEVPLLENVMVRFGNGRAWPSFSPDGGRILFVRVTEDQRRISILDLESSEVLDLGPGEFPAFSPDGEWIAFTGTEDKDDTPQVFLMKADGSERRQLTHGAATTYPAWSPEGSRLVFCRLVGERTDLFVMPVSGNRPVALTATPGRSERHPSWSPDGSAIAYTAIPDDAPNGWQRSVFVVTAAGGPPRQVTPSAHNDTRPVWVRLTGPEEAPDYLAID